MVPYREMEVRHRGKMELLPHAAADTEHLSRVEGAKQAVDQQFARWVMLHVQSNPLPICTRRGC